MKNSLVVGAVVGALLSGTAIAGDNIRYECRSGSSLRAIEVIYMQRESPVPCEVRYRKQGQEETLWKANYEVGYCEKQAAAFVRKQENWGWLCEQVLPKGGSSEKTVNG